MVHVDQRQLGWQSLLQSWIASNPYKLSARHMGMVGDLAAWLFEPTLAFLRERCSQQIVSVSDASKVHRALELLAAMLTRVGASALSGTRGDASLQGLFAVATIWSLGGALSGEVRCGHCPARSREL